MEVKIPYDLYPFMHRRTLTRKDLIAECTEFFDTTFDAVLSSTLRTNVSMCRKFLYYYMKNHFKMRREEIGKYLNKNQSAVTLGLQKHEICMQVDDKYRKNFIKFKNQLGLLKPLE